MVDSAASNRLQQFAQSPLQWLLVRHFLSADLMQELCSATVSWASKNTLTLGDICESELTFGPTSMVNWAVRPLPGGTTFEHFLKRFIQTVVWQGDETPGEGSNDASEDERSAMADLYTTLQVSLSDLSTIGTWDGEVPVSLTSFVNAMLSLKTDISAGDVEKVTIDLPWAQESVSTPLPALLTKHLGDLAADMDEWRHAVLLYDRALAQLLECKKTEWQALSMSLKTIIYQSSAMADIYINGADQAVANFENLVSAELRTCPLAAINGSHDAINTKLSAGVYESIGYQANLMSAPLVIASHDLGNALSYSSNGKYREANRWYWAVLRRQIALGSHIASKETKGLFGRSIIDELTSKLGKELSKPDFALATRFLIDSGSKSTVDATQWSEELIATYADEKEVDRVITFVSGSAGAELERAVAAITIFSKWLSVLPTADSAAAERMILFLAKYAKDERQSIYRGRHPARDALKALEALGNTRPEFLPLAIGEVVELLVSQLQAPNFRVCMDALESLATYLPSLDGKAFEKAVGAVATVVERELQSGRPTPAMSPALRLLSSDAVTASLPRESDFGVRILSTLVKGAMEADHQMMMYLLRSLDRDFIEREVSDERLDSIVTSLQRGAMRTNSSGAISNAYALLIAPRVAKREGVSTALGALQLILTEATSKGHSSLIYGDAFLPLLYLGQHRSELEAALSLSASEAHELVVPLLGPLKNFWKAAAENPLVFATFSIPSQSSPNSTLVHNWAFASFAFAKSLGALEDLEEAMAGARAQPLLRDHISVARAVGAAPDELDEPSGKDPIADESKGAFYGAFGQRLVLLSQMPEAKKRGLLERMLAGCLRHGPQGVDAAVFTLAINSPEDAVFDSVEAKAYRVRLRQDRKLRQSLFPMFVAATRNKIGDDF
ncbi:hypothetical protein AGR8A_pTi10046 [Agrobacterium fabrum str. J-07]|uniref:hypothetical protein n=1 Tax=Agrobacterium fabrum TaxID=1176649 RepID=UPI0009BA15E2|nr:hypothetical protein [Agrobacterium fabrum]CUX56921.1 hypothetical protein AGR8A_pTi10046 [Agrobacterium fabrum str. J-07]